MLLTSAAPGHCASLSCPVALSLSYLVSGAAATTVLAFGLWQDGLGLKAMKFPLNYIPPCFWTTRVPLEDWCCCILCCCWLQISQTPECWWRWRRHSAGVSCWWCHAPQQVANWFLSFPYNNLNAKVLVLLGGIRTPLWEWEFLKIALVIGLVGGLLSLHIFLSKG